GRNPLLSIRRSLCGPSEDEGGLGVESDAFAGRKRTRVEKLGSARNRRSTQMSDAKSNRPSSAAQSFHSRQSFGMRLYRFVFLVFFRLFGRWALGRDRWNETVSDLRRLEAMPPVGFHQGKAKK